MKHIAKVSKHYSGKAIRGGNSHESKQGITLIVRQQGPWLIDAPSSPEVSW